MLTAETRIETERGSRYLTQLCKHASAMTGGPGHRPRMHLCGALERREVHVHADWTDARGTLTFTPWGECTLSADATALTVRIAASDEDNLKQIVDVITRDLERFGRRDQLTLNWHYGGAAAHRVATRPVQVRSYRLPPPQRWPVATEPAPHSGPRRAASPPTRRAGRWPLTSPIAGSAGKTTRLTQS